MSSRTQSRHYWRRDTSGFSDTNVRNIRVHDRNPVGIDNRPMVLHHTSKTDPYAVREMTYTDHVNWHKTHGWHR